MKAWKWAETLSLRFHQRFLPAGITYCDRKSQISLFHSYKLLLNHIHNGDTNGKITHNQTLVSVNMVGHESRGFNHPSLLPICEVSGHFKAGFGALKRGLILSSFQNFIIIIFLLLFSIYKKFFKVEKKKSKGFFLLLLIQNFQKTECSVFRAILSRENGETPVKTGYLAGMVFYRYW